MMGKKPPRFLRSSWRKGGRGIKAVFDPWQRLTKVEWIKKGLVYGLLFLFSCLVFLLWNPSDEIGNRYLLSAVFQGLVTVLGIAISAFLIVMQISASRSRSALTQLPVRQFTMAYLLIYSSVTISPLIVLADPRFQKPLVIRLIVCGVALVLLHLLDVFDALLRRLQETKVENQRKEGDRADG